MIRLLFILIVAGLVGLGAMWLADHDGVLVAVLFVLIRVAFWILGSPAKLSAYFAHRRARRAYDGLTKGLIAAAAGDAQESGQAAKLVQDLLDTQPLALLLQAEAARLSGEEDREESIYRVMLNSPETEFLGLRGLFLLALRRGNADQALSFAIRARTLRPKAAVAAEALFDLRLARGEWSEAEALLVEATQAKLLAPESARRRQAALAAARTSAPEGGVGLSGAGNQATAQH